MPKKSSASGRPVASLTDSDGNSIGNKILLGLSSKECKQIVATCGRSGD